MSDDDLIDECVKSLAKIHKYSYDKVNKLLLKGVVKRWDMDENALGAFTMFNPFQVRHYFFLSYRVIKLIGFQRKNCIFLHALWFLFLLLQKVVCNNFDNKNKCTILDTTYY